MKKTKISNPNTIQRAEDSIFQSLINGSTASELIIQEAKWIYGISYEESKKAFLKAHEKYIMLKENMI